MAKVKKKLTTAQMRARKKTKEENHRPPMIEGIDAEEDIQQHADPIWLHQHGLWEYIRNEGEKHEADTEDRDKR